MKAVLVNIIIQPWGQSLRLLPESIPTSEMWGQLLSCPLDRWKN